MEGLRADLVDPFVGDGDGDAFVEERQFAEAGGQRGIVERQVGHDLRVRLEPDLRAALPRACLA
jgi:hypothetical protein